MRTHIHSDGCAIEHKCASCNSLPGCAFCHMGQESFEVQGCFNTSSYPLFCRAATATPRPCPHVSTPEQHDVADVAACRELLCSVEGTPHARRRDVVHCRLPLLPWLLLTSYTRMDVLLKAVLADVWVRNERTAFDDAYKAYVAARTGRPDWATPRLEGFKGLVASVQQRGFDWPHSPIRVHPDFTIMDGSHRVAVALALNHSHIVVAHPGCSVRTSQTQATPQTMSHLKRHIHDQELVARIRKVSAERLGWGREGLVASPSTAAGRHAFAPPHAYAPPHPAMKADAVKTNAVKADAVRTRFWAIVWGCARHLWPAIVGHVHGVLTSGGFGGVISSACVIDHSRGQGLAPFVRAVYAVDDVSSRSLDIKLSGLERCTHESLVLNLSVSQPQWRQKANGKPISRAMEALKLRVRRQYKAQVPDYIHDVILHAADNEATHTRHLDHILAQLPKACSTDVLDMGALLEKKTQPNQRVVDAMRRAHGSPRTPVAARASGQPCVLLEQASRAHCTLDVSFGCDAVSRTMWVQNCRGSFRCLDGHQPTSCGWPPGLPFYNCSCSGLKSRRREASSAERAERGAEGQPPKETRARNEASGGVERPGGIDTLTRRARLPSMGLVTALGRKTVREQKSADSLSRRPVASLLHSTNTSLRPPSASGDVSRRAPGSRGQPPVAAFLEHICERLVYMVIKLDGQPARFPSEITTGGDVDLLTTPEHFLRLQAAVTRFFSERLGVLGTGVVTSRAFSRKPFHWQFRMEQRGRLIYQVHLIQAADAEAAAMLGRRVRLVKRSPCLWAPAPADAARLRERDCVEKRNAGRASSLCAAGG